MKTRTSWLLLLMFAMSVSSDLHEESAGCFITVLHPRAFSQVPPSLVDVRACSNCPGKVAELLVSMEGAAVSLPFEDWQTTNASCPLMVHAKLRGIKEGTASLRVSLVFHDGGQELRVVSEAVVVRSVADPLKRFLFLLHVDSLWKLREVEGEMRTRDSDVVAVVCSPPMEEDELRQYVDSELEFLSTTNSHLAQACSEKENGVEEEVLSSDPGGSVCSPRDIVSAPHAIGRFGEVTRLWDCEQVEHGWWC
ncbi:hypothetical protein GUITHDRAFT_143448 [Guillardia theta CCMP2712]|uniref:Uncharacterized protein n=1 Tax=Guillardia theta (strain CCMP2712) TaxID=905079 RepID=L1IT89_GUITC|nr:hypothetical protein GUITHDRAFT_143448 [Guillardia theta CCMP2712]EKX39448.1 hypothetical protein GUITHDRAFT_143448 [Guillardia theta CCMP2712]|eukprot:XP_005826428.1 hypothetical protein GUITHDRAFT_143448 [Guillardia theta CCMP2712]